MPRRRIQSEVIPEPPGLPWGQPTRGWAGALLRLRPGEVLRFDRPTIPNRVVEVAKRLNVQIETAVDGNTSYVRRVATEPARTVSADYVTRNPIRLKVLNLLPASLDQIYEGLDPRERRGLRLCLHGLRKHGYAAEEAGIWKRT